MTEKEYLTLCNREKIKAAISLISGITPHPDYGITDFKKTFLHNELSMSLNHMAINIESEDDD